MMRRTLLIITHLVIIMLIASCSQRPSIEEMEPEQIYRYLMSRYEKEKYLEVSEGFDFFTLNYSGHALVDSAQFLLGMAHFNLKEYILSADSFDDLTRRFPNSALVADAMYMIGESYWKLSPKYSLDQGYTIDAIDALQTFIDYFPYQLEKVEKAQDLIYQCRKKLAHKSFANGMIYLKMKNYRAAGIYFQTVIDQYYDTDWAPKATFKLSETYVKQDRIPEAKDVLNIFLQKYPDHSLTPKVQSSLNSLGEADEEISGKDL